MVSKSNMRKGRLVICVEGPTGTPKLEERRSTMYFFFFTKERPFNRFNEHSGILRRAM
jgi:hypothetical protein